MSSIFLFLLINFHFLSSLLPLLSSSSISFLQFICHQFDPGPDGVKRFLLGRQLIVVPLGFLVAQITHFNRYPTYNFSPALYFFTISLGLPGKMMLLKVRGYWFDKVVNHDHSYQSNCCALSMEFFQWTVTVNLG